MKRIRIHRRKNRPGWHVSWYEGGKEKTRAFQTKQQAEHFQHLQYQRLNAGILQSQVDMPWAASKVGDIWRRKHAQRRSGVSQHGLVRSNPIRDRLT